MPPLRLPLEHHLRPNEEGTGGPEMPGLPAFVRLTGRAERGWMLADLPEDLTRCLRGATGIPPARGPGRPPQGSLH